MSDERKSVRDAIIESPSDWGHGRITAHFQADKYPGTPLLDTRVELIIDPFSITWNDRQKLVQELKELIAKYQI